MGVLIFQEPVSLDDKVAKGKGSKRERIECVRSCYAGELPNQSMRNLKKRWDLS